MKKFEAIDDKKEQADDEDEDEDDDVKHKTLKAQSKSTKKDLEPDFIDKALNKFLKEEFGREQNTLERTDEGLKPKTNGLFPVIEESDKNRALKVDIIDEALNKYLKEEFGREQNTLERTDEGLKLKKSDLFPIKEESDKNRDLKVDITNEALNRHLKEEFGREQNTLERTDEGLKP